MKVAILPTLDSFKDDYGGEQRIIQSLYRHLPEFGWAITSVDEADVVHCLATATHPRVGVYANSGWQPGNLPWQVQCRKDIMYNLERAKVTVAYSQVSADFLQPLAKGRVQVIPIGVEWADWHLNPAPKAKYALFGKGLNMTGSRLQGALLTLEIAQRLPHRQFVMNAIPPRVRCPDNVTVIGIVGRVKWDKLLCDASVYLSTTKEIGASTVVQAMAAGVPVVSVNEGSTREYMAECGFVGRDPEELAYFTNKAFEQGAEFRQRVRDYAKQYDWSQIIPQYVQIYKEAM